MSQDDAEKLWAAYIKEVERLYGVAPKNFLGNVAQHKERFMKAAHADVSA